MVNSGLTDLRKNVVFFCVESITKTYETRVTKESNNTFGSREVNRDYFPDQIIGSE